MAIVLASGAAGAGATAGAAAGSSMAIPKYIHDEI
jgi:hypothetical protein